jgi:hypothetical protein
MPAGFSMLKGELGLLSLPEFVPHFGFPCYSEDVKLRYGA